MQLIRALVASGMLLCATSSALAERWVVTEGQRGEWTGRWHLQASTGNAITGTSFCSSGGPNRWSAVITED